MHLPLLLGAALAQANPALSDYCIHARDQVDIRDQVLVQGAVHSDHSLVVGSVSVVEGAVASGETIFLRSRAHLKSGVSAGVRIDRQDGVVLDRAPVVPDAVPAFPLQAPTVDPVSGWETVPGGRTMYLEPGAYGNLVAYPGASLNLSSGEYHFRSFSIQPGGQLSVDATRGPVRILVSGNVDLGDRTRVEVEGGNATSLAFETLESFRIGTDAQFQGTVVSPRGEIHVYSRTRVTGALRAANVVIEPQAVVVGQVPPPPSPLSISGSMLDGYVGHVVAHFTADNHYGLFHGRSDGTGMVFEGRNEKGPYGSGGEQNWQIGETFEFQVEPDDHLYMVVWDDGQYRMWIGDFTFNGTRRTVSNLQDWEYITASGPNPFDLGGAWADVPALEEVSREIAGAQWSDLRSEVPMGTTPWGYIPEIDPAAKFVWAQGFGSLGGPAEPHYKIFRSKTPAIPRVPLPSWTVFLDRDADGQRDPDEPVAVTNANGEYRFDDIVPGTHRVAYLPQSGWDPVLPAQSWQETTVQEGVPATHVDFLVRHP
ncbi:MAG: hypothetical protein H6686_11310 [Fibrobacteria bacterium]|nr:hypothetical protein [Fibrobacteria bacterium]